MAFTVEDGTGVVGANSYVDLAYAAAYFADRNVTAWAGTTSQLQGWLIDATDYVEGRFGDRFIGTPNTEEQALHFPVDSATSLPDKLKRAVCEYALRAKVSPLAPDPTVDSSGFSVVTIREKLGPLETESAVRGSEGSRPMLFRPYPAADMLLKGLLIASSAVVIR